jgi:hypothetical protein
VHIQAGQCGNQIGAKFWEVRPRVPAMVEDDRTVWIDEGGPNAMVLLCTLFGIQNCPCPK